jgi:hypothetical protein
MASDFCTEGAKKRTHFLAAHAVVWAGGIAQGGALGHRYVVFV